MLWYVSEATIWGATANPWPGSFSIRDPKVLVREFLKHRSNHVARYDANCVAQRGLQLVDHLLPVLVQEHIRCVAQQLVAVEQIVQFHVHSVGKQIKNITFIIHILLYTNKKPTVLCWNPHSSDSQSGRTFACELPPFCPIATRPPSYLQGKWSVSQCCSAIEWDLSYPSWCSDDLRLQSVE